MSAPAASSASSRPTPQPIRYVRQGRYATRAFGFLLDREHFDHWCTYFYRIGFGENALSKMSAEKAQQEISYMSTSVLNSLGHAVYREVPTIPRLRRAVILYNPFPEEYLFVLKDNSSHEALHCKYTPEEVKAVREFLGLQNRAQWYDIHYVQ